MEENVHPVGTELVWRENRMKREGSFGGRSGGENKADRGILRKRAAEPMYEIGRGPSHR